MDVFEEGVARKVSKGLDEVAVGGALLDSAERRNVLEEEDAGAVAGDVLDDGRENVAAGVSGAAAGTHV